MRTIKARPPRFAEVATMAGLLFLIFAVQSILILNSKQYLHAIGETYREPEQGVNCAISSYQVQPGDTINSLASQAGTTGQSIRDCNDLSSDAIRAGETLTLPGEVKRNQDSSPQTRVTRAYRPTPATQNRYQSPNNGNAFRGSWHTGPRQQRQP